MYNRLMNEREINVKAGDRVDVQGHEGVVTDVYHGIDKQWNGKEYEEVKGTESTFVEVHFDETDDLSNTGYDNEWYGGYTVIEEA